MMTNVLQGENNDLHTLKTDEVLKHFNSSLQGLTQTEVESRQVIYGKNRLPLQHIPSALEIFIRQFKNPLIYILLAAGGISLAIGDFKDTLFIFIVIFLNAAIGTFQEWKSEHRAAALQNLLKIYAHIKRDGREEQVLAEELVPGDIVFLESGFKVPADIRLLQVNNLTVDEALLTGESLPVGKKIDPLSDLIMPVSSKNNMTFAGTTVAAGRGMGIVTATGLMTEVGKIADTLSVTPTKTPLLIRMEAFSHRVGYVVLGSCTVLALIAFSRGMAAHDVFFMAVALAVSAIPEGLPVAMTVALSLGSVRMSARNVIVRKLMAVEGLGSCTLIASDKTGTLTLNKQTVKLLSMANGTQLSVSGEGYNGEGHITHADGTPLNSDETNWVRTLAKAVSLCSEGNLYLKDSTWHHQGDPIDVALLGLGYKAGYDPQQLRNELDMLGEIPFESERMYAAQFYREQGQVYVALKGAMETVLPMCQTILTEAGEVELDRRVIESRVKEFSQKGYRVLVVATGTLNQYDSTKEALEQLPASLMLLGLIALIDPLRPNAREAIQNCKWAGIKVVMVTGDHPETALAIARDLGIAATWDNVAIGAQLEEHSEHDVAQLLQAATVFARVTPVQKLHIVEAFQKAGHFVAVTGDGVNDAPALRTANIGVAMGSGTDIAKDTASIIITDDNFSSIVAGVEEGRFAYDNVRKVIYLLISAGAAELTLFALSIMSGLPIPLLAVQLLWVNLVTNGLQDVALAFEKGEAGALSRPPRNPKEGIFNPQMIEQTIVSGLMMALTTYGVWFWLLKSGVEEATSRNIVLLLLVLMQNFHVFNCRSERVSAFRIPLQNNIFLILAVILAQSLHIAVMHIPVMQSVLKVQPVSLQDWGICLALASSILIVMELFKAYKRYQVR